MHVSSGERDEAPNVEIDLARCVQEEFGIGDVLVNEPIPVVFVLSHKGSDIMKAAGSYSLFGPLSDSRVE